MRVAPSLKALRAKQSREARQAEIVMPTEKGINYRWERDMVVYIAMSEWGAEAHAIPAVAIRLAQDRVPSRAKPSQLLVYRAASKVMPIEWKHGAPVWPENGEQPQLCGLTTTHTLYVQSLRMTYDSVNKESDES